MKNVNRRTGASLQGKAMYTKGLEKVEWSCVDVFLNDSCLKVFEAL